MKIIYDCLVDAAIGVVIALVLRRFVFILALVKGNSMLNTLRNGEIMFARRYTKQRNVQRLDIVICRYPNRKGLFVKRVIGMPGEKISMEDDRILINDQPLNENFDRRKCLRKLDATYIPSNAYFVMGDNRPISRDSRAVGSINRRMILARPISVIFPFKAARRLK